VQLRAAFGLKSARLRTFYSQKRLISIALQWICPYSGSPNYTPGDNIEIPLIYSRTNSTDTTGFLSLRIHYNSQWIKPLKGTNSVTSHVPLSAGTEPVISDDTDNQDGDASTDKAILINWDMASTSAPPSTQSSNLATIRFSSDEKIIDPISRLPVQSIINVTDAGRGSNANILGGHTTVKANYSFDIDNDGITSPNNDGLLILRKLLGAGFSGDALTDGAVTAGAARSDAAEIHTWIERGLNGGAFDIDRDGKTTALGDGLLILWNLTNGVGNNDLLLPIQPA
jgi:hypothetical protein